MIILSASGASVTIPQVGPVLNGEFEVSGEAARLVTCPVFGDGDVNVFEPGNPYGLPWLLILSPCNASALRATHWSGSLVSEFGDFDGDLDREVRVQATTDPSVDPNVGVNHNFWQAYPSPHQAWTFSFEELTFRVEDGTIPSGALVQLSGANYPLGQTDQEMIPYQFNCQLTFKNLEPDEDGVVSLDPVEDGEFKSRDSSCDATKAAFDAAKVDGDDDAAHAALAEVRIVQHSYWHFNSGSEDVVLDGIEIVDGISVVEALAGL